MTRRLVPADRRVVVWTSAVTAVALVVALVCVLIALRPGSGEVRDRDAVAAAAASSVQDLMTFTPDDSAQRRAEVDGELGGVLGADYRGRGPDVVLAGATESGASMTAAVQAVAVDASSGTRARVMVFADQSITLPGQPVQHVGVSRWATLQRLGGRWLLTRIEPVAGQ
ncbi:MAG: hypothetical protein QM774_13720 [Gordonia sp. (in: high G+C Gram-positive bacteria)]|uniref:hypothetical protein n=1 Tax=Gordonia sp. (in: high G+C Gram-positive bacteria) TaxID=84139 RepID=UPI0039E56B69